MKNNLKKSQKRKKKEKTSSLSVTLFKLFGAGLFLWIIIKETHYTYQLFLADRYGVETTAVVYKTTKRERRGGTDYYIYYEFPVKRRWFKTKDLIEKNEYFRGDSVRIKYLPKDPDTNFRIKEIDSNLGTLKKILPFWD